MKIISTIAFLIMGGLLSNCTSKTSGGGDTGAPKPATSRPATPSASGTDSAPNTECLKRSCGDNLLFQLKKNQLQSLSEHMLKASKAEIEANARFVKEGMALGADLKVYFPDLDLQDDKTVSAVLWLINNLDQAAQSGKSENVVYEEILKLRDQ